MLLAKINDIKALIRLLPIWILLEKEWISLEGFLQTKTYFFKTNHNKRRRLSRSFYSKRLKYSCKMFLQCKRILRSHQQVLKEVRGGGGVQVDGLSSSFSSQRALNLTKRGCRQEKKVKNARYFAKQVNPLEMVQLDSSQTAIIRRTMNLIKIKIVNKL